MYTERERRNTTMTVKEEFSVLWQNFGGKLKRIAVILYYLGLIALVYLGFLTGDLLAGVIVAVPGAFLLWLLTGILHAFGELIENVQTIKDHISSDGEQ